MHFANCLRDILVKALQILFSREKFSVTQQAVMQVVG